MDRVESPHIKVAAYTRGDFWVTVIVFMIPHFAFGIYALSYLTRNWESVIERNVLLVLILGIAYCFLLPSWMILDVLFHQVFFYEDHLEERKLWRVKYVNLYTAITELVYVPRIEIKIRFDDGGKISFIFGDLDEALEFLQSRVRPEIETNLGIL